jgi:excisionase family DNA binding protein
MPSKKQRPNPIVVGLTDAAFMLGVSKSTLYRLLANGQLAAKKMQVGAGNTAATLIPVASIEKYLASLPDFVPGKGRGRRLPPTRIRAVK